MIIKEPYFCQGADNVYRTKHYIVKQQLIIRVGRGEENAIISTDTYYLRNRKRDKLYELWYQERDRLDGKRIMTALHTRRYID